MTQQPQQITNRPKRVLVGKPRNLPANLEPVDLDILAQTVFPALNIALVNKVMDVSGKTELLVVEMSATNFEQLKTNYAHRLIIEEDYPLELFQPITIQPPILTNFSTNLVPSEAGLTVQLVVKDSQSQQPIANAHVNLTGSIWYAEGVTDQQGRVQLTLYGETPTTLRGLMVRPDSNYWSFWMDNPTIRAEQDNTVYLKPIAEHMPGFPQQESLGWGQQAMGLKAAQSHRGRGIKVGIIDSGGYIAHEELGDHAEGKDFTQDATATSWQQDEMGHGTHVAGVIVGLVNASGIKGFAPEADYFVYKIFPGGTFAALINSLNQCIAAGVDVVNLSLGSSQYSELLEQKIQEATEAGVACIAAAGNSATKLQYPAAYTDVFAVSAIGEFKTFPQDSTHLRQIGEYQSSDGRFFTAKFTCFAESGQRMDVCAPGVAVVSAVSVQADAYAAWDGTSMACPHVVGLAALMLEAREDIRSIPRGRSRVEALFQAIRDSADDLGLPRSYQGSGLPNTLKALGVKPQTDPWQQVETLLKQALQILRSHVQV
jgi:subtilisin